MLPAIQQGMEQYHEVKPEDDIDLIAEVRQCLMSSGLGTRISHYDNNHFIKEAVGKKSEVQRYLLNRYWSSQLFLAPVVSLQQRYTLIHDGNVSDWLTIFKQSILPFIIENNLPVEAP